MKDPSIMEPIAEVVNHVKKTSSEEINTNVPNGFHEKANGNAFADILREATADGLRKRNEGKCFGQVNDRINNMIFEISQGLETSLTKRELLSNTYKHRDKRQSDKEGTLPDKEFLARNSLFTDLFKITHIRTVYNLFMVTLSVFFINTIAYDIMESGTLMCGTVTIQKAFAKFPASFYIWSLMQISTFCVYVPFNLWSNQRFQFSPKSLARKIWDYGWLTTLILYQVLFLILPLRAMLKESPGIACRIALLLEQIRMMMKCHAFVRTVAPSFISYKLHSDVSQPKGPGFSQYLYFLFAPTIVYRDKYPRTDKIRWTVVVKNFMEFILAVFYLALILERFVVSNYYIFGTQYLEPKWVVKNIIEASIPGILIFISGNYLLLHSWMNAWAEMLQFADRLFYKDWWNSTSYHMYYRTWNVVVHDWLYTYIYKDMYEILMRRNKMLAALTVFLVSAIFHEYILAFGFTFFFPIMFVMFFGIGYSVFYVYRIVVHNTVMLLSFYIGIGIILSTYAMEYYARLNCPPYSNYYLDLFAPRSWTCQAQFVT